MNIKTTDYNFIKDKVILSAQQTVENDVILPDYYADISKILSCSFTTFEEAVCVSGENISLPAGVEYNVIYCGVDDKLYCYSGEIKYTKYFQYNAIDERTLFTAEQKIISQHCKAIGPKRVEVKGNIIASIAVSGENEATFLSDECNDQLEVKTSAVNSIKYLSSLNRKISVNDTLNFDNNNDTVEFVYRKDTKVNIQETKSIQNKIFIKGSVDVSVLFVTFSGNIINKLFSLPISEVLDINGLTEADECKAYNIRNMTRLNIKNSENNITYIEIASDVFMDFYCERSEELVICVDAYSRYADTELKFIQQKIITDCEQINRTVNISEINEAFSYEGYQVIDSVIENSRIMTECHEKNITFVLSGKFRSLLKNRDNKFMVAEKTINYECFSVQIKTDAEFQLNNLNILNISAVLLQGNQLKFSADVNIDGRLDYVISVKLINEIEEKTGEKPEEKSIVIYFSEENEDLWNIAKNNHSTMENIRKYNEINSENHSGRAFVFPNF